MRDVLMVTGGRADWGLLRSPARHLAEAPEFRLCLLATGAHLDSALGATISEIEGDGFVVDERLPILDAADDAAAVARALGRCVDGVGAVLARRQPDLMVVLGDRYEILGAVSAALLARVPVAHIAGGDFTEGAVDDAIRHAITKMAHLHFATNEQSAATLVRMGEDPARVHRVGSPGLDDLHRRPCLSRADLLERLGLPADRPALLVTFHPPTLETTSAVAQFDELCQALDVVGNAASVILTGANADMEGRQVSAAARRYADERPQVHFTDSLGHDLYAAALASVAAVVGNSSSGLYEAPSFGIPTVNIGDRQQGRLKASSVIDCPPQREAIVTAIRQALRMDARGTVNPYGDGRAGERIVGVLRRLEDWRGLVRKSHRHLQGGDTG